METCCNNKKKKAMVVEKIQYPLQMPRFRFKKNCKIYSYLGTIMTNNRDFKTNIGQLCNRARGMYILFGSTKNIY